MRIISRIKQEFVHGSIIFTFFFITLNVINLTEGLLLRTMGIQFPLLEIFIVTTLITKIILILDHLPIVEFIADRPLIYRIAWKSLIYWIVTFIVRQSSQYFHFFKESDWNLSQGWSAYVYNLDFKLIIAVNSWYFMLLILFITANELTDIIGSDRMRKIFFGKYTQRD